MVIVGLELLLDLAYSDRMPVALPGSAHGQTALEPLALASELALHTEELVEGFEFAPKGMLKAGAGRLPAVSACVRLKALPDIAPGPLSSFGDAHERAIVQPLEEAAEHVGFEIHLRPEHESLVDVVPCHGNGK
ncbi:MAG: hypothetical protein OEY14_08610 [Myxococcales bacterium]|nr:hypothetical protein [Myxococcales bacterium]